MIKHFKLCLFVLPLLSISACSHHQERKTPCPQTASMSENPCNPMPINVANMRFETNQGDV